MSDSWLWASWWGLLSSRCLPPFLSPWRTKTKADIQTTKWIIFLDSNVKLRSHWTSISSAMLVLDSWERCPLGSVRWKEAGYFTAQLLKDTSRRERSCPGMRVTKEDVFSWRASFPGLVGSATGSFSAHRTEVFGVHKWCHSHLTFGKSCVCSDWLHFKTKREIGG